VRERDVHLVGLPRHLDQAAVCVVDAVGAQRQPQRSDDRDGQHHVRGQRLEHVGERGGRRRPVEDEVVLRLPAGQAAQRLLPSQDLLGRVLARPGRAAPVQAGTSRRPQIRLSRHPQHRATL
jgi:hypothetical protein